MLESVDPAAIIDATARARMHAPFLALLLNREPDLAAMFEAGAMPGLDRVAVDDLDMPVPRRLRLERRRLALIVAIGDLAEVLDKIGRLIRQRFELRGHVKSLTAEGRLSGVVLLAMPPSLLLFMSFSNYEYVSVFFSTPFGAKLLSITAGLQIVGAWVIKKIVAIKV